MTKSFRIRLTTLTPVHIGSGVSFDPTQFFIDENDFLNCFNTSEFLERIDEKQRHEFSKICLDMNYVGMFRFFREKFPKEMTCRRIKVVKDIAATYRNLLATGSKGNQIINQLELKRTCYNEFKKTAYVPGSSLKGSLKTAWMSAKAVKDGIKGERDIRDLERKVLEGSFSDDPFRFVKISDLFPEQQESGAKTRIVYATNHRKDAIQGRDRSELAVPFEVLMPGNIFTGQANLGQPPKINMRMPKQVDLLSLAASSNEHYFSKLEKEEELLKGLGCEPGLTNKIKERAGENLFKTTFPVRIGHHSGAEFLTLDGNRQIKIRKGPRNSETKTESTTVWLASAVKKPVSRKELAPFGWVLIEFIEE
ncbi:MAG: RAMP superfamily CRISPR-associated protein [Candidatus Rifleibacteriota bacterium]